ncbi:MAG: pyruvoyl-dependent arginine decarboxylase [Parcubacteria group bacterium ADurb.Bin159]|jgi:arginine decarboxylase|nr:MAG: pyruvoyl-dependent arginine decarboxylase [Parcubacteria group bacterium ADurb.Bin159]
MPNKSEISKEKKIGERERYNPFNKEKYWQDFWEREKVYKTSGHIFKTTNITQSAEGDKRGLWTTVVAVAVFLE